MGQKSRRWGASRSDRHAHRSNGEGRGGGEKTTSQVGPKKKERTRGKTSLSAQNKKNPGKQKTSAHGNGSEKGDGGRRKGLHLLKEKHMEKEGEDAGKGKRKTDQTTQTTKEAFEQWTWPLERRKGCVMTKETPFRVPEKCILGRERMSVGPPSS